MNNDLIKLPYGENFKECWESYLQFMMDNNRDTSIKAQNYVLMHYQKKRLTEQEAIDYTESTKEILIKCLLK